MLKYYLHEFHVWWLVTGLSPWRPGCIQGSGYVRFVVDKVALGQDFLWVLWTSYVSVIPTILHPQLHLHIVPSRRQM